MLTEIANRRGETGDVKKLVVGIFAVHDESFPTIVKKLHEHGVRLAQIRFIHHRGPRAITVLFDHAHEAAYSLWRRVEDPLSTREEKFYNIYAVIRPVADIVAQVLQRRLNSRSA